MKFIDFDLNNNLKICEYDERKIPLCTTDLKPIKIQIPRMYMPFGVSGFTPKFGSTKFSIDFSMKGWNEENNYTQKFFQFIKELEQLIITKVVKQSTEIFGSQLTVEEITKMFNSNIKEQPGHDPKFRVKIDNKTRVFDESETDVTSELDNGLYSKHSGVALLEVNSVYFMNQMFGITWKALQMKIYEPRRLNGFQFQISEDF